MAPLILASSSQTRIELMQRLHIEFQAIAPEIDESVQHEQHADDLAQRLAFEKAAVISKQYPHAIVIGSDQVAWRENEPHLFIGKPLTVENAIQQLKQHSGKSVYFSTAFSVQCADLKINETHLSHFAVKFRNLTLAEIERYVAKELPLYCAGSFKCEGLGISLFESMTGDDQTTLMGLPMIQLCNVLRRLGLVLP